MEIKLFAPIKGKKYFEVMLVDKDENCIIVEDKGEQWKIELTRIAKINRAIEFEDAEN